tara:strand:- start:850 stop:1056 length:207 start_codon:yes stop_codon:yes gene_type:complete
MKFSLFLFFIGAYKNNIISKTKLYFELGNNYNIISTKIDQYNSTKKSLENGDAAMIPLKDVPKHSLIW